MRVLLLSTTAFTLLFAVWLMFGVLAVPIKEEFGLNAIQFAWLTSIAILSGSLWRLPMGMWTDRVGGKVAMTIILLATAVPCYFVSTASSFTQLIVFALLFGIAGNSFSIGIAWNAAWSTRERQGFALGTFGAGNVGASVTKLIGPALLALIPAGGFLNGLVPGGWRFIPVMYAVMLLVMAAFVWFGSPANDLKPGAGRSAREMLKPLSEVRVWRFGLYYIVVFGAYVAMSLWLPNYYKKVYGLSLSSAALLTALFIFPASLLRPVGGWLSDRFGARPVTYVVFVAMTLACLPPALSGFSNDGPIGLGGFVACIEVLAIGMGIGKASVYKYIPEYFPKDVGAVGGLVGTIGALGGFLLPLGFGYLEAAIGRPEGCFWVIGGLVATSMVWLHLVVVGITRSRARQGAFAEPSAV